MATRVRGARIAGAVGWIGNAAGVGLLWAAFSLPIITMFASTAALLTVLRRWMDGDQPPVIAMFREAFAANFRRATAVQLLWMVATGLAWSYLAFATTASLGSVMRVAVIAIALLLLMVAGGTTVFALPVLVDHPAPLRQLLRNSALLAGANPGHAILGMLVVLATVVACIAVIPAAPVTGVGGAYLVYRICRRAVRRTTARARRLGVAPEESEGESGTDPAAAGSR